MAKIKKTNAMRTLERYSVDYKMITYDSSDGKIDGLAVAEKIGKPPQQVFKTLVTQASSQQIYVFVIPVLCELSLKKAAHAVGEKKIAMLHVKDLQKTTGYIRGGCSPIGMKKLYPTIIDVSARNNETIVFSGGKIGMQIELPAADLANILGAKFADVCQ